MWEQNTTNHGAAKEEGRTLKGQTQLLGDKQLADYINQFWRICDWEVSVTQMNVQSAHILEKSQVPPGGQHGHRTHPAPKQHGHIVKNITTVGYCEPQTLNFQWCPAWRSKQLIFLYLQLPWENNLFSSCPEHETRGSSWWQVSGFWWAYIWELGHGH